MAHRRGNRLNKSPFPFVRNDADQQAQGLILWYPGANGSNLIYDQSISLNNGIYGSNSGALPSSQPGINGGLAFSFPGTPGNRLKPTRANKLLGNVSITVSLWANFDNTFGATEACFNIGNDFAHQEILLLRDSAGKLLADRGGGTVVSGTSITASKTWYHVCFAYNTVQAKIYINGVLEATNSYSSLNLTNRDQNYVIGSYANGLPTPTYQLEMTGRLDDIRLYNRALTDNEAADLYDLNTRWLLRYQLGKIVHFGPPTSLSKLTSDTPTISENVQRVGSYNRIITETPTLSEFVTAGKFYTKTTNDSPTISESVVIGYNASKITADTPTVSETITIQKTLFKSISQPLTITQSYLVNTPIQNIEQGLSISQSVDVVKDLSKSLESELFFSQSADYEQFVPTEISQSLTITQSADFVQTTGVNSELTITQDVAIQLDPHFDGATQGLTATQTVVVGAVFNRAISQPLTLVQTVGTLKIKPISASSTLIIGQLLEGGVVRKVFNTLDGLDQDVDQQTFRNKSVNQSLAITQSIGLQMILNRNLVSTLVFKDEHPVPNGAGGIIQVPNLIYTRGGSTFDNCSCTVPSATTVFQSSTRAIVLPNPEYNDSEGLVAAVSIQKTITGQTYSYVKKSANRKLKYKFIINQRKAYELRRFLLDFLGERHTMTNFKGEIWSGYFLTDPAEIVSIARGGTCTGDLYEVNLEFQGVRLN